MEKIDPKETIFYTIENAIKTYRKYAQKKISEVKGGITVDQMLILTILDNNPGMAQNEIAELIFKDHASITRMIEILVKNKYLKRSINESDRRKFNLVISDLGRATIKTLKPLIFQNRRNALQGVSEAEVNQLFTILNKLINNCK